MLEVQRHAGFAVGRVLGGRNLNQVLQGVFRQNPRLTPQQRAAIQDLSFGALRHLGRLDAVLGLLLQKPLSDESVRCLLRVALYQLAFGKTSPHAVVNHAVETVRRLRKASAAGLVNAVLRNFLRRREALLEQAAAASEEARYDHPQWWIAKLRQQYPHAWSALLEANNQHPPMTLRVNRRQGPAEAYLARLSEAGVEAELLGAEAIRLGRPVGVDELPGFREGAVSVQDAGAQRAAPLLDTRDGLRVLDACAAPGGKTAHILELAAVEMLALDNDGERLERVRENLDRLGLRAELKVGDAARPEQWWDGRPFDRILADVPCSASGVVRRHPDIKWLRREEDIAAFAAGQAAILSALWRTLASGGKLLYATCSVFAEENQRQVAAFLQRQPDARLLPLDDSALDDGQLLPNDRHDGFYYALLGKE
ncbi:MAG: 16S rRNA (cytosine(967)-C(5))-methyltransferase RsmB [Sulfuricellaceae bacterium]